MAFRTNHGGRRVGSGRCRTGKFTRSYFITDQECKAMDRYLWTELRGKPLETPIRRK